MKCMYFFLTNIVFFQSFGEVYMQVHRNASRKGPINWMPFVYSIYFLFYYFVMDLTLGDYLYLAFIFFAFQYRVNS